MAFNPANAIDPVKQPRWGDPGAAPKKEKESKWEDFGEGVWSSLINTWYGVKGLATDITDEEKARMADWEADAAESWAGTAGRVAGEIGQMALPGAGATKLLRAAGKGVQLLGAVNRGRMLTQAVDKGRKLAKAAPVLGDAITSAGFGYLQHPKEGFTRGQGAQQELIGSLLGSAGGGVLSKSIRGIKRSPVADKLMGRGVYLTPGQAAQGEFIPAVERVMEYFPLLGISRGTGRAQKRAQREWFETAMNAPSPRGKKISEAGLKDPTKGILELKKEFNLAYDEAWSGAQQLPSAAMVDVLTDISRRIGVSDAADAAILNTLRHDIVRVAGNPSPAKAARAVDKVLRKAIRKTYNSKSSDLSDPIMDLRQTFREGFPNNVKDELAEVDKFYPDFLTVRKAVADAQGSGGEFVPGQLTNASRMVGKEIKSSEGRSPLYDLSFGGESAIGNTGSSQELLGTWRKLMQLSPPMVPMQYAGRFATGQTLKQRGAQAVVDSPIAQMLRRTDLVGAGRVGAAAYEE